MKNLSKSVLILVLLALPLQVHAGDPLVQFFQKNYDCPSADYDAKTDTCTYYTYLDYNKTHTSNRYYCIGYRLYREVGQHKGLYLVQDDNSTYTYCTKEDAEWFDTRKDYDNYVKKLKGKDVKTVKKDKVVKPDRSKYVRF